MRRRAVVTAAADSDVASYWRDDLARAGRRSRMHVDAISQALPRRQAGLKRAALSTSSLQATGCPLRWPVNP
jgi:hypothetical protein